MAGVRVLSWDEAVEHEIALPAVPLAEPTDGLHTIPGGEDIEPLVAADGTAIGRVVRRREPLAARVRTPRPPTTDSCG